MAGSVCGVIFARLLRHHEQQSATRGAMTAETKPPDPGTTASAVRSEISAVSGPEAPLLQNGGHLAFEEVGLRTLPPTSPSTANPPLFEENERVDIELAIADLDSDSSDDEADLSPMSRATRDANSCFPPGLRPSTSLLPRSLWSTIKLLLLLSGPLALFLLMPDLHLKKHMLSAMTFVQQNKGPGALLYILIYSVCTVILLPVSLLSIAGGVIFAPIWLGLVICMVAVCGGSLGCFLLGRYLFRNRVQTWLSGKGGRFAAIDRAIASGDARGIVILLRMSPIVPFSLLNYVLSLTDLTVLDYTLTAAIGSFPSTSMAVVMGSFLGDLAGATSGHYDQMLDRRTRWLLIYVSTLLIIVTSVLITLLSRRTLRRVLARQPGMSRSASFQKLESRGSIEMSDLGLPAAPSGALNPGQFTVWERRTLWWTLIGAVVGLVVGLPMLMGMTTDDHGLGPQKMAGRVVGGN